MEREAEEQQADKERMDALTRREEALTTRERELEEEARWAGTVTIYISILTVEFHFHYISMYSLSNSI